MADFDESKWEVVDVWEDNFTIIEALDRVQSGAAGCKLEEEFWDDISDELDFLTARLEMSAMQVVVLAILCEIGEAVSWRGLGRHFGVSRLKMMGYEKEIVELVKKRWVYKCGARDRGALYDGFHLVPGVLTALRENKKYIPERLDGFTEQEFIDRIVAYCENEGSAPNIRCSDHYEWIRALCEMNPDLPLSRTMLNIESQEEGMVLILAVNSYVQYKDSDDEPVSLSEINVWFDSGWETVRLGRRLQNGDTLIQKENLIEFDNDNGMIDCTQYRLTEEAKRNLLGNFRTYGKKGKMNYGEIIQYDKINGRQLFYNPVTEKQVTRLRHLLEDSRLQDVRSALDKTGMRRGVTCLFYGAPGTGKTETVMQLAREAGRNVLPVNIAGIRDKFVGESEKNIRNVFRKYRDLCERVDKYPILLFNEADAILGKRFENMRSSVEKMDNAMQNIILQEMENFDGIMIATTNLTENFDKAFDRRFLFKVEFNRPDKEARYKIWQSMLPEVEEEKIREVSSKYDFSGGEIENVARKYMIERILDNNEAADGLLPILCKEESLRRGGYAKMGF